MFKKLSVISLVMLLSACSITQNIEPAHISGGTELCIIENPDVREGFIKEFQSALSSKGIQYKLVPEGSVPESCEWTSTYVAKWTWDLSLYMSYAEIKIFHKGSLDGEAIYDSTRGGANMNKFIDAEPKIRELVEQLIQIKSASLFMKYFG